MAGFIGEMRRSGNGLLVRVSVIAAVDGLLFGDDAGVIFRCAAPHRTPQDHPTTSHRTTTAQGART